MHAPSATGMQRWAREYFCLQSLLRNLKKVIPLPHIRNFLKNKCLSTTAYPHIRNLKKINVGPQLFIRTFFWNKCWSTTAYLHVCNYFKNKCWSTTAYPHIRNRNFFQQQQIFNGILLCNYISTLPQSILGKCWPKTFLLQVCKPNLNYSTW